MISPLTLALVTMATPAATAGLAWVVPPRQVGRTALAGALATAVVAGALAGYSFLHPSGALAGQWLVADAPGGLLLAIIGLVGLASVAASPAYLRRLTVALVQADRRDQAYYSVLLLFWAVLLVVPLAGNLGEAWLLVEATTAISAVLVGFSGTAHALEAAWKYLILTSLGLGIALLGIAILTAGLPGGAGELAWTRLAGSGTGRSVTLTACLLIMCGLAAKIGWAPVHNWLPDAHSEAPPPVSALLSGALLPTVLLIAWRCDRALAPAAGPATVRHVLIAFGLVSVAVAVPFLWRPMPFKRLLAYSSLEHLGVMAIGLGFGTPLALAGVALHIAGHAVAKALAFYAATPLLAHEPQAATRAVTGIGRNSPALGAAVGLALGALSGLPPSPLFVSEVLILAGGFSAGEPWTSAAAAVLLALAFLGLAHAAIETTVGEAHRRNHASLPGLRFVSWLTAAGSVLLLGLAAAGPWLVNSGAAGLLGKALP